MRFIVAAGRGLRASAWAEGPNPSGIMLWAARPRLSRTSTPYLRRRYVDDQDMPATTPDVPTRLNFCSSAETPRFAGCLNASRSLPNMENICPFAGGDPAQFDRSFNKIVIRNYGASAERRCSEWEVG